MRAMASRLVLRKRSAWPIVALPTASPWPVGRVGIGGAFEPFGELPVPLDAIVRWDPSGKLWALDPVERTVTGYAVDGDDLREFVCHAMPSNFVAVDMAIDDRRVYLGGAPPHVERTWNDPGERDVGEPMAWFRERLGGGGWAPLAMPFGEVPGKSVDALVFDGGHLVAVDDLVTPKWFFVFDPSGADTPTHVRTVELIQGSYEKTCGGAATSPRWIALRSTSVGSGGSSRLLTVFERGTLETRAGFVTSRSPYPPRQWDGRPVVQWKSSEWGGAAFVGEWLLVAGMEDGLFEFDCDAIEYAEVELSGDFESEPLSDDEERGVDLGPRVKRSRVLRSSTVLDVVPVEAWHGALVIVELRGHRRAIWHPVGRSSRR